jgi:DNA polymerase-3 subunit gamma/tau
MSNDDDPWLEPVQESSRADGGPQDGETRSSAARPEHPTEALPGDKAAWDERRAQQDAPGTHVQPADHADVRSGGKPRTSPSGPGPDAGEAPARRQPRVAADEDTYTMQDKSLNGDGVLDIEGITRLFDVKQVETFAADDPLNPINVEHHKQQGHE